VPVLSPPDDLAPAALADALGRIWAVSAATMQYRPLGWGSHHWEVVDTSGGRWFVTVDDLRHKRHTRDEPLDVAFGRLRASLGAARALHERGHPFVVAPVPGGDGDPVARIGDRFAVALYPFVAGASFAWGPFSSPEHRDAVLDLIVTVHTGPIPDGAPVDDFAVPHRDDLSAALDGTPSTEDGPYAERVARLVASHADSIRRLVARYDELVDRADPSRAVLTHGEPHPGNTMLSAQGWLLIDWDTVLVAQPERDLWGLARTDPSIVDIYARATGVAPQPAMLELFGLRWDIADIAVGVARFRHAHADTPDDAQSFRLLTTLVTSLS
jgi:aminoglycoside phosphotransferase (APT) family kinase protein